MNEIVIAGAGTGAYQHLTLEVMNAIEGADVVVSSSRFFNLVPVGKKFIGLKNFSETFDEIKKLSGKILILVSGDPCLYSMLQLVKKNFGDTNIKVLSGISSFQILCAKSCESWNNTRIFSGHGRELNIGEFLNTIERNEKVILFCDKKFSPQWVCNILKNFDEIEVFIGSNLGGDDEIFLSGSPQKFYDTTFSELSIILIKNYAVYLHDSIHLCDKDFLREKNIVMTNENVRAVIISKLELQHDSLLWDIGAGSGSISICAAYENLSMQVYAIEKKHEAVNLISRNIQKFHLHNIQIHEGIASDIIKNIPVPTHVFIGGSGGELEKIFDFIIQIKSSVHVVIACVTLENFNQAYTIMKDMKNFEAIQISTTSSKILNDELTMMKANNPVIIMSADT